MQLGLQHFFGRQAGEVFGFELTHFQFNRHQPFHTAVVKQKVNVEVVVVDLEALLPSDEGKTCPQFQQEVFKLAQDGIFQVFFQVAILKAEKVEDVGVFQHESRSDGARLTQGGQLLLQQLLGLL